MFTGFMGLIGFIGFVGFIGLRANAVGNMNIIPTRCFPVPLHRVKLLTEGLGIQSPWYIPLFPSNLD